LNAIVQGSTGYLVISGVSVFGLPLLFPKLLISAPTLQLFFTLYIWRSKTGGLGLFSSVKEHGWNGMGKVTNGSIHKATNGFHWVQKEGYQVPFTQVVLGEFGKGFVFI
jgi:hypothetical protein